MQNDLGDVLETDVAHGAIAADGPYLGQFSHFLVGHQRIIETGESEILTLACHIVFARKQGIGQSLRHHGTTRMIDNRRLADEPADGSAVLEKRVHPRVRMRIGWWSRTIDGVTAGVCAHVHDTHAVGVTAVDGLHVAMIKRVLTHHSAEGVDDFLIGNVPVRLEARGGVLIVLSSKAHHRVGDPTAIPVIFILAAFL